MNLFGIATIVALRHPIAGLTICVCCLVVYLKPEPSLSLGQGDRRNTHTPAKSGV
jgi:hypothetical protein